MIAEGRATSTQPVANSPAPPDLAPPRPPLRDGPEERHPRPPVEEANPTSLQFSEHVRPLAERVGGAQQSDEHCKKVLEEVRSALKSQAKEKSKILRLWAEINWLRSTASYVDG